MVNKHTESKKRNGNSEKQNIFRVNGLASSAIMFNSLELFFSSRLEAPHIIKKACKKTVYKAK